MKLITRRLFFAMISGASLTLTILSSTLVNENKYWIVFMIILFVVGYISIGKAFREEQ